MQEKVNTISNLFEGHQIRSIWDSELEDYHFSVVDVIEALTDSSNPRDYWYKLKVRMTEEEQSQLSTKCRRLKMLSKDGKMRLTDTLDTEGIFRLIESVPSPKAEPFKLWLARLGREKVDEVFDPSKGVDQMIDFYLMKGYTLEWIEARIKAIIDRKKLTNTWKECGVEEPFDYAILTNEIYKVWSGMTAQEYKDFKGIKKENLRDNMTDIEVVLTTLGEVATRDIADVKKPKGLKENKDVAILGGTVAKSAKDSYEGFTNKSAISSNNNLKYRYIDNNKMIK